ncbi:MAG TPA: glycosyltransferase [Gemmatimonadales bacterium]
MSPAVVHVASGREWRGGQRQVWLLARALGRAAVEQVVVTGAGTELAQRLQSSGVRVRPASWSAGLDPRVLWPILQELRSPHAVLHAHDAHSLSLSGTCAALTGAPLVVTRRVIFPLRRRGFWLRARRVIAISEAVRNALVADGVDPERIVVIPSAVDIEGSATPAQASIRHALRLPENGRLAVCLAALTPEKDHSTLVAAAALLVRDLPNLHWVIAGEGPLRGVLEQRISAAGLKERFHLVGQLPDPHTALAGADVCVLSSTSEGLGSSILAAMALGVPVVATRVGGIPELLGTGAGLMVSPGDSSAFAAAVRRVLTEPGLRENLVRIGRHEASGFSVHGMAERVLGVYRSCVHSLDGS